MEILIDKISDWSDKTGIFKVYLKVITEHGSIYYLIRNPGSSVVGMMPNDKILYQAPDTPPECFVRISARDVDGFRWVKDTACTEVVDNNKVAAKFLKK